jgi:hypothetical protein
LIIVSRVFKMWDYYNGSIFASQAKDASSILVSRSNNYGGMYMSKDEKGGVKDFLRGIYELAAAEERHCVVPDGITIGVNVSREEIAEAARKGREGLPFEDSEQEK